MNFQKIIFRNHLKTSAVLVTYIVIFIFIGLLVDIIRINAPSFFEALIKLITFQIFPLATLCMLGVAVLIICFSVINFKQIILSGSEYKLLDPSKVMNQTERRIYGILEDLIKESDTLFVPKLYIIDAPYINAFASGWNENNSLIALTSSLIKRLEYEEIKAVMAHELSHIRHGDIRLTMCVGILSNIMLLVTNSIVWIFLGSNHQKGANTARTILLILQFILPIFTFFLQMYLSRSREYMADSGAAYIMNDSRPMIRALQKISADYNSTDYSQVDTNPTRKAAYIFDASETFSTHPSTQNRIKSLLGR
ncbi:zinc metalloprotease HtpX [Helicobacter cappadocius]|uniref:Zinc metalloprotease HtpX n=1 Tax=Helicobacter cappadocius TaxID=3063998 RepID=A0AA90PJG6_9HELI|nr:MULTISPECIES: zinc metalloprotease HtpX [unclassified Helicobacter]MDO7252767.1 zinc metalloprotease HtpX [Helicobacter sp. faydin-H75]MDP2538635.1 zinc metalloprotease HtpX [Helicobacter sp. faydin-H76]